MASPIICCCEGVNPCWVKIVPCCDVGDPAYVPCLIADQAGIPIAGTFLWNNECWTSLVFGPDDPPPGSTIIGAEIVGQVQKTFLHCIPEYQGDPDACCTTPRCWYLLPKCCNPALFCADMTPDEIYVECATIDAAVGKGQVTLPFTAKPVTSLGTAPFCTPCYTASSINTVSSLPIDATVVPFSDLAILPSCAAPACCPQTDSPCPMPCSLPSQVVWDVHPVAAFSTCDCIPPATPQAWPAVGAHDGPFGCGPGSPVADNGCYLWTWTTNFACNPVIEQGVVVGIQYVATIFFKQGSGYDINADCVPPGGCAYQFPGQTCNDPCAAPNGESTAILATPTLPIGQCPNPSDFTITLLLVNMDSPPSIVALIP